MPTGQPAGQYLADRLRPLIYGAWYDAAAIALVVYAETIVRLVMGSEITARTLQRAHEAEGDPLRACTAASLVFMAARLILDEQKSAGSRQQLIAKLAVNKMEKRLIGFVKRSGVRAWPHSCEFIVGPYASAAQFAQVQARYAASERWSSIEDPDPEGFAGA